MGRVIRYEQGHKAAVSCRGNFHSVPTAGRSYQGPDGRLDVVFQQVVHSALTEETAVGWRGGRAGWFRLIGKCSNISPLLFCRQVSHHPVGQICRQNIEQPGGRVGPEWESDAASVAREAFLDNCRGAVSAHQQRHGKRIVCCHPGFDKTRANNRNSNAVACISDT